MKDPEPVTKVIDRWGKTCYVATRHLQGNNPILSLYTRRGTRWTLTHAGDLALRQGQAVSIHRANIARIDP